MSQNSRSEPEANAASAPDFLGAVLKAVVSTPNRGESGTEQSEAIYRTAVIEPTRRWRRMKEEEASLSDAQKRHMLGELRRIFEVKRVELEEQRDRFREIGARDPSVNTVACEIMEALRS